MRKAADQVRAEIGDRDDEMFFDRTLPEQIPAAPYRGEKYEAQVPDTPELIDYAHRSINALTRMPHPVYLEVPQVVAIDMNPPIAEMRDGSLLNITPKWLEVLPMMRVMTGSDFNIDVDAKLMGSLVHSTGIDGLNYYPVEGRPWAFYDGFNKMVGRPFYDIFGEGRQLLAYAAWYQHDKNPLWKKLMERKVRRLMELSVVEDGMRYFRSGRGVFTPWADLEADRVPIAVLDVGVTLGGDLTGGPATYMGGFIPQAGAQWHRLTGSPEAMELATGLGRFVHQKSYMLEEVTGRFIMGHAAHVTHSMVSNLSYALSAGDQEMIKWVRQGFEHHLRYLDPDRVGIIHFITNDVPAEMIVVGIKLSQHGWGNYWEDVDRWIRNSFLPSQFTEYYAEKCKQKPPVDIHDPASEWEKMVLCAPVTQEGLFQPEGGLDAAVGLWNGDLNGYVLRQAGRWANSGGTTGNCWRTLYYVWDSVLEADDKTLKVNLHLNRASPWADLDSHIPYEGKLVLKMKTPMERVLIRIPEWTDWNQVTCKINGAKRNFQWSANGYIGLSDVEAGDRIVVEFPIRQWMVKTLRMGDMVAEEGAEFEITLKGNTVIDADRGYDLVETRKKYVQDQAPIRHVVRFASTERFIW